MSRVGYLDLLRRNGAYRRLWAGEVVSYTGDWFSTIALLAIVHEVTDSALAVSGVMIARTLPVFLVSPVAGPLADRLDRRGLMIGADVARAACVVGLIAAHHTHSLLLLYATTTVMIGLAGVFIPARGASIQQLTSPEELPVAMALSGGTWSVMLAIGAALGGLATAVVGIDGSLLIDAATFLVSAALLQGLPALPAEGGAHAQGARFVDGLHYLRRTPHVAWLTIGKAVMQISAAGLVMLPLYGQDVFPTAGALWVGVLYAFRGVGAAIGALGGRAVVGDHPAQMRRGMLPAFLLIGVGQAVTALAGNVWVAGVGYLVAAIGSAAIWVFAGTLLQFATAAPFRGRVFSLQFGVLTLVISAISAVAGGLVDGLGWTPDTVMWASALAIVVLGLPYTAIVLATGRAFDHAAPAGDAAPAGLG
ncbi:MAG: MFS transporter [Alphaproteobacteria bacterium]|nr:MFS transporter [Alphaproteobacteria bacterium]